MWDCALDWCSLFAFGLAWFVVGLAGEELEGTGVGGIWTAAKLILVVVLVVVGWICVGVRGHYSWL